MTSTAFMKKALALIEQNGGRVPDHLIEAVTIRPITMTTKRRGQEIDEADRKRIIKNLVDRALYGKRN
jgi:hypothetical protein